MDEDALLRRLLARRILMQLIGGTVLPEQPVVAGIRTAAGRHPIERTPQPNRAKRGAKTSKVIAQSERNRTGVGVETAPPERERAFIPGEPGTGVRAITHTSRPLTPAELFRDYGR